MRRNWFPLAMRLCVWLENALFDMRLPKVSSWVVCSVTTPALLWALRIRK